MIFYSQTHGTFLLQPADGSLQTRAITGCYSGHGACEDDPSMQSMRGMGPLPRGVYTIGPLHTVEHLGPCLTLTPDPLNEMFGRAGFLIHLDNPAHIGQSSEGCIVVPNYAVLETLNALQAVGDNELRVTT